MIAPPKMARQTATTISFGTKVSVCSLIEVAAWTMPRIRPASSAGIRIGARGERQDPERLLGDADEIIGAVGNHLAQPHVPKEAASEPIVSAQPSTSTNSSSLNGIETIVGDSIIMPSDIRVDETTRSMIRKGRKIRKPIWNAVFSSLVTKAGQQDREGHVLRPREGRRAGHVGEQAQIALAGLADHEAVQRPCRSATPPPRR